MTTTMRPEPKCHRGDVVLVLFPHSDLVTVKTRPALVVQANGLESGVPQLIVAMISSRLFRAGHPSRVFTERASPEGQQSGLLGDSIIMTDNLATVATAVIDRVIGSIPMAAVDRSLRHSLGL